MKSSIINIKSIIEMTLGIFLINLSVIGFTIYKNIKQAVPQTKLTSKDIYLPKLYFIAE